MSTTRVLWRLQGLAEDDKMSFVATRGGLGHKDCDGYRVG